MFVSTVVSVISRASVQSCQQLYKNCVHMRLLNAQWDEEVSIAIQT